MVAAQPDLRACIACMRQEGKEARLQDPKGAAAHPTKASAGLPTCTHRPIGWVRKVRWCGTHARTRRRSARTRQPCGPNRGHYPAPTTNCREVQIIITVNNQPPLR